MAPRRSVPRVNRGVRGALAAIVLGAAIVGGVRTDAGAAAPGRPIGRCDWPTWGYTAMRPFSTGCPTELTDANAKQLRLRWFFNSHDVVTATPTVVGRSLYVGDWSGRLYALRTRDGKPRWTFQAKPQRLVYSGQIVASAAVADVRGTRTVFVPSGKTMYALRASDGKELWRHTLGKPKDRNDPTEIESSPAVVDGKVVFGWDVHNSGDGNAAGVVALDARTGKLRWKLVTAPNDGTAPGTAPKTGSGCGDVWGSPSVDAARKLVIFGTGNCVEHDHWGRFSDAMVAVDLDSGAVRWVYQPHANNQDDLDFAGAPNLFDLDGHALAGLGNKDGTYYVVDRTNGELVSAIVATQPGLNRPGGNFSTGGFIGPSAYRDGMVVGGTAVGPAPYLHGLDVRTGTVAWQNQEPSATYAATAITGNVAIVGGTDFTLRAVTVDHGDVLWSHPMKGAVAGGAAITRGNVFAVAGIREPGLDKRSRTSGVYRFALHGKAAKIKIRRPTTSTTRASSAAPQDCVGSPCPMQFDLKKPPTGLNPSVSLEITESPFELTVKASGLGPPEGWLRPGSAAAQAGASAYAIYLSESDDNPTGGLICVLDEHLGCTGHKIPRPGATYNRATLIAVKDPSKFPPIAEGFERLVTTQSFNPPLQPSK